MNAKKQILVLGLGNDLMGDDAIGLLVARELRRRWNNGADVVEAPVAGFALLDFLEGYDRVLIIDSVSDRSVSPGSLVEFSPNELPKNLYSSPHFVGLNDVIALAKRLDIPFPTSIRILAVGIEPSYVLREGLSSTIAPCVTDVVDAAGRILRSWGAAIPDAGELPSSPVSHSTSAS